MNPTQPQEVDEAAIYNPLKVMQPGERVICEIKRHSFGLMSMYSMLLTIIIVAILVVIAAPHVFTSMTSQDQAKLALAMVIVCVLTGLFTYIGTTVYKGNRWIVTSDSITQVSQVSLFSKQTSQLSLANLEDVTVEQQGIFQSMFGFGRLRAETAGEKSKFVFDFCPRPTEYAKQIIAAHEAYIAQNPEETHTTNQSLTNSVAFNQPYIPTQQPQPPAQPYDPTKPYQQ